MEAAWVLLLGFVLGAVAVLVGLAIILRRPREGDDTQRLVDEIENAPDRDPPLSRDRTVH